MDVAALLKQARLAAGISRGEAARRSGVGREAWGRYEAGSRLPSLSTLDRMLGATGHQLRCELEEVDADLRRALDEAARVPVEDRPGAALWEVIIWLPRVPHRVEGAAAMSLLGVPVPVERYDIAVADDEAGWDGLARAVGRRIAYVLDTNGSPTGVQPGDGPRLRRLVHDSEWRVLHEDGRFSLYTPFAAVDVRMASPDVVARHIRVATRAGTVPVAPRSEIATADSRTRRMLDMLGEGAGAAWGGARVPDTSREERM